jgi:hypothetical protein
LLIPVALEALVSIAAVVAYLLKILEVFVNLALATVVS